MAHSSLDVIPAKHVPRTERFAAGRALRQRAASPPASGRDPVAILAETDSARIPELWYTRMDVDREVRRIGDDKLRATLFSTLVKAKKDLAADDNFPHLVKAKAGGARIADRPPLIYHFDTAATKDYKIHAHSAFANYESCLLPERRALVAHYRLADTAFKVVGVGSVGTFCAVGLFMTADGEPLFLQVKQPSVLEKIAPPSPGLVQQGCRVVEGQRAMQAASDIFLGWTEEPKTSRHFYVRSLRTAGLAPSASFSKARRSMLMQISAAERLPARMQEAAT